jgi:hypothetical protein
MSTTEFDNQSSTRRILPLHVASYLQARSTPTNSGTFLLVRRIQKIQIQHQLPATFRNFKDTKIWWSSHHVSALWIPTLTLERYAKFGMRTVTQWEPSLNENHHSIRTTTQYKNPFVSQILLSVQERLTLCIRTPPWFAHPWLSLSVVAHALAAFSFIFKYIVCWAFIRLCSSIEFRKTCK